MAKRKSGAGKVFASVLITALIVGGIGFASSGFSKWNKEDWEARIIPERVFEITAVEKSADLVNSPDTTITADETEANLYHVGGAILYQEEAIEGLTGHLYEAKVTLKDENRKTAALKVSKGLDETVKTADLKWLGEDNSYTLLDVAEVGVDTVLTFDNDGDFETLDDQLVLTFKVEDLADLETPYRSVSIDLSNVTLNDFEEQAVSSSGVSGFLYSYRVDPEIIIRMYGGETQLTEIDFISPNREEVTSTPHGYEKVFVLSRKNVSTTNGPRGKKIWDFKVNGIEIVLNSEVEQTRYEICLTSPKDADGNYLPIQTITFKEALEF